MTQYAVMPLVDYTAACDTIRENTANDEVIKSSELPQRINDVFKAGQFDIVSNSKALKGTAKGIDAVEITDTSPIEHDVACTVERKNIFDGELQLWRNSDRFMPKKAIKVKRNTNYRISVYDYTIKHPNFAVFGNNTGVIADGTDVQITGQVYTFNSGEFEYIWFRMWETMTDTGTSLNSAVQIEEGSKRTAYAPYIEDLSTVCITVDETKEEHRVNPDGAVEGIKSLYPSMTLVSDTEGVIITAQYIKDIDKAFEERLADIEAAIVNND